ncbi:MAG: T9SS type A sorting domain-containing protein [Polaribacter sp.]|uniref:T9SS type A sorting domain-containing protein n=1 Tax=Polaribacter sp. TaxID=1920175 RepID=UPI003BAE72D7
MKKILLLLTLLIVGVTFSQVPQTLTLGSGTSSSATRGPFQRSSSSSSSVFSRAVMLYSAAELSGLTSTAVISQINFDLGSSNIITASGNATMLIYMKNSSATEVPALNTTWNDAITGATLVGTYTFNTTNNFPGSEGFLSFVLDSDFDYTGNALEVAIDWDSSNLLPADPFLPNLYFSGNGSLEWHYDNTSHTSLIYQSGSSSAPSALTSSGNRKSQRVNTQFIYTDPNAENTLTIGTGTSASATRGPFQRSSSTSNAVYSRASLAYTATELTTLTSNALISKIDFDLGSTNVITASGDAVLRIYMKNSSITEAPAVNTEWINVIDGATLVGTYTFNTSNNFPGVEGFLSFDLDTNFNYTGGTLEVAVDWDCSALVPADAGQPNLLFSGDGSLNWHWTATSHVSLIYQSGSSSAPSTLSSSSNRKSQRANTQFVYKVLTSSSWDGSTDTDWHTAANWSTNKIPTDLVAVSIPTGLTNYPIANAAVTTFSINMAPGTSFIANSTVTGNVTYNRTLDFVAGNANGWHLVASPVAGQAYNNAYATANNLATSGSKRGLATYNDANGAGLKFTYLEDDDSNAGTFTSGIGYSVKRGSTGTVAFTGTINTNDVNGVTVSTAGNGFNLLGSPYTSYISSQTFLDNNSNLDQTQIWIWKQGVSSGNYITMTAKGDNFILAPGQGFFVKATSGTTVNFAKSNQAANADTFQKSSKTEVQLLMNDGENNRFAKFYFLNNVTNGFDAGYEGEVFGGIESSFDLFSQLVEDNLGKNYQVQSLPLSEIESTITPLGIKAIANKEITFSVETLNLPEGINVFLEDREKNIFTNLKESNYKITLEQAASGIGRFYLHTSSKSALSTDNIALENVSIYKTDTKTLRIVGLQQGKANIKLYNVLGKQVMNSSFESNGVKDISLTNLAIGVYIIQLQTENGNLNKKIILE